MFYNRDNKNRQSIIGKMISEDVLLIILAIILGLSVIYLIGDPRFKEGFANPEFGLMGGGSKEHNNPEVLGRSSSQSYHTYEASTNPYHIYDTEIDNTRPYNVLGTLTQQQCYEQDGNRLPEKLQDYSQRTNNYKHTYPDSCNAPFKELVGNFYAPREGAIGSPIPLGGKYPSSTSQCQR